MLFLRFLFFWLLSAGRHCSIHHPQVNGAWFCTIAFGHLVVYASHYVFLLLNYRLQTRAYLRMVVCGNGSASTARSRRGANVPIAFADFLPVSCSRLSLFEICAILPLTAFSNKHLNFLGKARQNNRCSFKQLFYWTARRSLNTARYRNKNVKAGEDYLGGNPSPSLPGVQLTPSLKKKMVTM